VSFDNGVTQRTVIHSNVIPNGTYGAKGTGTGIGNATINAFMPAPSLFVNNAIVGADCSQYPATTLCTLPAILPNGFDGRAIGADTAAVNAATRNAVVAP
jgi:hypothetical protein